MSTTQNQTQAATHTPAPWKQTSDIKGEWTIYAPEARFTVFRIVGKGTVPTNADRDLILAAPELLAALKGLLADKYLADAINADRMQAARAAVAKAEGR